MKERRSTVEPYKETVIKRMEEGLTAVRIHQEIGAEGFTGKYSAVKKYVRKIKGKGVFVRVDTPAGHETQVDFGYVGKTKDDAGVSRKTWVFNMRLSHSRFDYYEKVYDQKVETLINCHANAFEAFKGLEQQMGLNPPPETSQQRNARSNPEHMHLHYRIMHIQRILEGKRPMPRKSTRKAYIRSCMRSGGCAACSQAFSPAN